ncbi:MAG: methyltransferase domain-containing protein [Gemmatimonadaceae bacterium]
MATLLTPARRRGVEILDDPSVAADVRERAMRDVARANRLFGGTRSALAGFREVVRSLPSQALLLDVGTGSGDIALALAADAKLARVEVFGVGMDISEDMTRLARRRLDGGVVGSALRIPLADHSVDVVACSQLLHHFEAAQARALIAELHRVSRRWVLVSDLRRSWIAVGGWLLASTALGFHEVTRADGAVSVLRGFTGSELSDLVRDATGVTPRIRHGAMWRLSATWSKSA